MRALALILAAVLLLAVIGAAQEADSTKPADKPDVTATASVKKDAEPAKSKLTAELQVCTGVEERQPVGAGDMFSADVGELCLWSKILGAEGEISVTHVWYFQGEEMASIELPVRSASWRTWSRKTIVPEWIGPWEVKVFDASGGLIGSVAFKTAKAVEPEG